MTYKVNEIFYSLQGEGFHTGVPAVFLRFSGCNLKCPFCDTLHADGREMDADEIVRLISSYPSRHVVITGGEPAMQLDAALVDRLHENGWFVQVETNGTLPLPGNVDWVTCSPKTDRIACGRVDEIKLLYMADGYDAERMERFSAVEARSYSLQPCDCPVSDLHEDDCGAVERRNKFILEECIACLKANPQWRLSLQTHKLLDIR